MKQKKITHTMQNVAVDILGDLEVILIMMDEPYTAKEIIEIIHKHEEKYALCHDPFTGMLCTCEEYVKNKVEYDRQLAEARFEHCDWLD
jgi:methyltransferase-like protein